MSKPIIWSLTDAWNAAAVEEERQPQPRNYLYASEIFGAKIDIYLKQFAFPYSNPPNDRSQRKFFAGHVWEYIVKQILLVCGLYHQEEIKVDATPYKGLLSVHGRCDFIAGGYVDKAEALAKLKEQHLPDILHGLAGKVIDSFAGKDLERKILETKSVALSTYDYIEKRGKPLDGHVGQVYHYERNNSEGYKGYIAYISKDTALLREFAIDAATVEPAYMKFIAEMTYYYTKQVQPPLEPLMGFDDSIGSFKKNLKVEYSSYLTMLYGYANPDEYRRSVQPQILRWNNALTRYAKNENGGLTPTGKKMNMTKSKEVRQEIINSGYDFNELLQIKMQFLGEGDVTEEE